MMILTNSAQATLKNEERESKKSLSVFPILVYDTDIGVGYGGKAKFVNYLSKKESFDFIVSTPAREKDGMFLLFLFRISRFAKAKNIHSPSTSELSTINTRSIIFMDWDRTL